ncbi:EamA family transporter [Halorussus halophilus]|uniref:EamA family transporter n=1 Tax=Halorussus halophilus TaxID=2650975 RepID=UPI00130139E2|nr:EamA family transporter [Halorussus halophilus]
MAASQLVYGLLAMFFWGAWSILASHAVSYSSTGRVVVFTYFVGLLTIGALRFGELSQTGFSTPAILLSAGSGLMMSLGTLAFYRGLDGGGLSIVPALSGLYFVVSAVYGVVALGEPLDASKVAGLVFAGIAVTLLAK